MAEFRSIHCKTWRDDWFSELPTDAKLLWLYLITNQSTSVSGIYQLPVKFMAFETGLDKIRVTQILDMFKSDGKIDYDDSVIWVKKMREYQSTASPKVAQRIKLDFDTIPDCRVKGIYAKKYGIDMVSVPYFENESDTDTDTDTETETETETIQKRAANAAPLPRAVQTYINNGGGWQPGKLKDGTEKKQHCFNVIAETVKDTDESIAFWATVVYEYCKQWSSKSYAVMLNEYYLQNRIPGQSRNGNKNGNGQSAGEPSSPMLRAIMRREGKLT